MNWNYRNTDPLETHDSALLKQYKDELQPSGRRIPDLVSIGDRSDIIIYYTTTATTATNVVSVALSGRYRV